VEEAGFDADRADGLLIEQQSIEPANSLAVEKVGGEVASPLGRGKTELSARYAATSLVLSARAGEQASRNMSRKRCIGPLIGWGSLVTSNRDCQCRVEMSYRGRTASDSRSACFAKLATDCIQKTFCVNYVPHEVC
jgi:hypothetical protein